MTVTSCDIILVVMVVQTLIEVIRWGVIH